MSEIKLKDVIHLYLGCRVSTPIGEGQFTQYSVETGQCEIVYGAMGPDFAKVYDVSELMPILRPLSGMTEEEMEECGNLCYDFRDDPELNKWDVNSFNCLLMPEQFLWLLSRHFDLFDLIESGQAIDKTKIPTPNDK